ncbi:sucrose porin [Orenia metallireducens]|uniref:Sucrose porin n=1 Tax=Orenia metallireducens TaxID=1413210 RepID=A0A285H579_9FIRM|nr:carbohydrate porin [Orenia metallireducens]PRX28629.1 sucrose porin [Orenia metallireducens]SNY30898.1 sucrose porin [Orenia metallireducens]
MKKRFSLFLTVALMLTLVAVPAFAKTSVSAGDNGKVEVTFTYAGNLDANAVYVAGEFNNWLPNFPTYKMKKENGVWTLTTQLEEGKYQYKFTVYGGGMLQWIKDDEAASFAPDGFGGQNSVVIADPNAGLADRIVELEKQMAVTNIGFNYSGYARSGYGVTKEGGSAGQPGIGNPYGSFRLGNEFNTFIENTFSKKWTADNGAWMKAEFLLAHSDGSDSVWEDGWANRQAFVEAGGMDFAPDLTFWAGKRFYGRDDIHILDKYWRNMSGNGAGIKGINLGGAKLDVAYVGNSTGNKIGNGELSTQTIDIRVKDIAVPGGTLELEIAPAWSKGSKYDVTTDAHWTTDDNGNPEWVKKKTETIEVDDKTAYQLGAVYSRPDFYGVKDGSSKFALQYGSGIQNWALGGTANQLGDEDASIISFLTYGVGNLTSNWDVMPVLIYQLEDNGADENSDTTLITTGARFVNYVTKNFAMQYELGYESRDEDGQDKQSVTKFTVAPTIKWDSSFWARPELRVFVTYAKPDNRGFDDGVNYDDDEAAITYGVQTELWW